MDDDVLSLQSRKMSIKSNRLNNPQIIGLSQFNTLPNYNESVLSEIPMTKRNSVESLSNAPSEIGSQNFQQLLSRKQMRKVKN